jgi:hypothetical protein
VIDLTAEGTLDWADWGLTNLLDFNEKAVDGVPVGLISNWTVYGPVSYGPTLDNSTQAHNAQHQNLPEVHAGAAGGLFARQHGGFQQTENLGPQRRMHPQPLQPGQDRRQLVPAPEGQANLFDGRYLKIGLGFKGMAHGGKGWRMLRGQTPKSPQTFNHHANIRIDKPAPISMRTRGL